MNKKKYHKHNDPAQSRLFNYRTWSNMTIQEQLMWLPQDGPWPDEKEFVHSKFKTTRFFSEKTWNRTPEVEQDQWSPVDDSDWPEAIKRPDKDEAHRQMIENQRAKGLDNLRVKAGQRIDIMGMNGEVLKWGPKFYLIKLCRKDGQGATKYGVMQRLTQDSSWGTRDILIERHPYTSFESESDAEQAYLTANR